MITSELLKVADGLNEDTAIGLVTVEFRILLNGKEIHSGGGIIHPANSDGSKSRIGNFFSEMIQRWASVIRDANATSLLRELDIDMGA